jgi:hypothetical protein
LLALVAVEMGYELTDGDAYRDPRVHGDWGEDGKTYSAIRSQHKRRLARDYNIFKDGEYLTGTEAELAHKELHRVWEMIGGDPAIPGDANHYQMS